MIINTDPMRDLDLPLAHFAGRTIRHGLSSSIKDTLV
jgi:hypothetical protein